MQEPHLWIISFFSSKSFTHTYTHSPNDYYEIRVTSSITKINGIRIVTWAVNPLTLDQNTLPVAACTRVITRITASPRQIVPAPTSPPPSSSWNDVANTWCHGLSSAVATICNPPANTLFTRSRESSPRRIALERVPHRHVIYSYRSKAPIITARLYSLLSLVFCHQLEAPRMSLGEQTLYQRKNQEPRKIVTRSHDETKTRAIVSHSDEIFNTCYVFDR